MPTQQNQVCIRATDGARGIGTKLTGICLGTSKTTRFQWNTTDDDF